MAATEIRAVLFDLDGTLVDSEVATDAAIKGAMARLGVEGASLPPELTRGCRWIDIADALIERYARGAHRDALVSDLDVLWIELTKDAPPIPGAAEALRSAREVVGRVAIVSSSARKVIDAFLARLGADEIVEPNHRIGAESVERSKPDPEGYLLAAERLGVAPESCVVFEDSRAGLTAARSAKMRRVAVLHGSAEPAACRALADAACRDYLCLPRDFWSALSEGAGDWVGQSWP